MEVVRLLRQDSVARLHFKRTDKSVNVLDEICIAQLEAHLDMLEANPPATLVLESAMPDCFIAGADLDIIAAVTDIEAATQLAERGQSLCRRIEVLPAVSIAVVHGACMGGGLEVALACDYIVAIEDKKTRLSLPEIKIGIHPGFGGCVRLPKRVGWMKAVDMILTGRAVDARRAKRMKLAALSCHPEQVEQAVSYLAAKGKVRQRKLAPWWMNVWPARVIFFQQVEKRALARFKHLDIHAAYPSVPATIALLREIVGMSDGLALAREAESLGKMAVTPACKNLIRVFHLGDALKKQEAAKRGRESASKLNKTAVYGAGAMGSGIAWVAAKTMDVDLHEVAAEPLSRGMKVLSGLSRRDRKRLWRIRPVLDSSGLRDTDVVIEAVLEDIDVKCGLWLDVARNVPDETLLLSNTSSLSITDMQYQRSGAVRIQRTDAARIAGLHFFNPAPKMPLVEVVAGEKTSGQTLDTICALAAAWGKYPIIVADKPGFLVNRCLMPFMSAALQLIENGQKVKHVDGALKNFGMPMGAIELADRVGLDICQHVGAHLGESFGQRFSMPKWFADMVSDGLLGEKSGAGFFKYQNGKQGELNPELTGYLSAIDVAEREMDADLSVANAAMSNADVVDACLIPMLVEALACLREKVVDDPKHLDAAFVYGIGFPPFRGGLLRYFAGRDRVNLERKIVDSGFDLPDNLEVMNGFC
jgi:3-hydroxyacyl-CoA dehydrogenase/enoyl-CoA hydratase/3-hydroxybutyryl-CoA epimerase